MQKKFEETICIAAKIKSTTFKWQNYNSKLLIILFKKSNRDRHNIKCIIYKLRGA